MTTVTVAILVENGYVPTELALVQDTLRIANRIGDQVKFDTRLYTTGEGDLITGTGGMMVRAQQLDTSDPAPLDHLVVLGGSTVGQSFTNQRPRIRWFERLGCQVLLLSDAASEWKKLHPEADDLTTHWENQQLLQDVSADAHTDLPLYFRKGRVTTAGGMVATADVVLNNIVAAQSTQLAQAVGKVMLLDRIRDGHAFQPRSHNDTISLKLANVAPAITHMEENIETPLPMIDIADISGVSVRQLERNFQKAVGQSPAAFYRSLRLRRAKALVEQTNMSMTEIAICCGFRISSSFAKMYAREFGLTPKKRRCQLIATAKKSSTIQLNTQDTINASFPLSPRPSCASLYPPRTNEAPVQRVGR